MDPVQGGWWQYACVKTGTLRSWGVYVRHANRPSTKAWQGLRGVKKQLKFEKSASSFEWCGLGK